MGSKQKKIKKPNQKIITSPEKKARGKSKIEVKNKISWCFSRMDVGEEARWSVKKVDLNYFWESMFEKIKNYESQTIAELNMLQHNRNMPITGLCREAQNRLIELKQDDIDEIYHIEFDGMKRLWGIFDGSIFRIVWWDPDHEICPSRRR